MAYDIHTSGLHVMHLRDSLGENGGTDGFGIGPVWRPAPGKRGADLLARLVAHGGRGVRVRRLGGDRAGEIRITRFLRNPSVTFEEMIGTAFARTEAGCAGRDVLAVQDTTVTRPAPNGGGGSFLHAMIAVDGASGAVLGPLDAQFLERSEGGKASRRQRAVEDRQSARWLAATRRAGEKVRRQIALVSQPLIPKGKTGFGAVDAERHPKGPPKCTPKPPTFAGAATPSPSGAGRQFIPRYSVLRLF
ncbi:MAG: hypothetical protein U1E59_21100 [Amaricoccus sp.]